MEKQTWRSRYVSWNHTGTHLAESEFDLEDATLSRRRCMSWVLITALPHVCWALLWEKVSCSQGWQTCFTAKAGLELLILSYLHFLSARTIRSVPLPLLTLILVWTCASDTCLSLGLSFIMEKEYAQTTSVMFYQDFRCLKIAYLILWITLRGRYNHFQEKAVEALKPPPENTQLGNVRTGPEIFLFTATLYP